MVRAYDDNGNVVDLVKWEKQIRADVIDECISTLNEHASIPQLTSAISFLISGLEQLKEEKYGKR